MSALSVGFSAERLAFLDRALKERYVDTGILPGTLIQIWRRGEIAHTSMSGAMDVERGKPMREDAIFRIYSMTKPIIGAAILMLAEEAKLDLDDDVAKYIPEWANLRVATGGVFGKFETAAPRRAMKIVHLLTHTSGLTYAWMNNTNVDAAYRAADFDRRDLEGGLEQFVRELGSMPLEFSPGEAWNYSVSIDVLGYLVQKISGQPLGQFLRERLFVPLGMDDTGFYCPPEKLDRFCSCYESVDGLMKLQDDAQTGVFTTPPRFESGGGGLVSTAHDYMRFCRMLLGGGTLDGVQVLSPKSVALYSTNLLPEGRAVDSMYWRPNTADWNLAGAGFSVCCMVALDVGRRRLPGTVGEFCWHGAAATHFWVDPQEDLAVVFMTQLLQAPNYFPTHRALRALVYGAMSESQG